MYARVLALKIRFRHSRLAGLRWVVKDRDTVVFYRIHFKNVIRQIYSQFGIVHADGKVEAREMDVERCTTSTLNHDDHFLPAKPDQCAYSRMVFPCELQVRSKEGHEVIT